MKEIQDELYSCTLRDDRPPTKIYLGEKQYNALAKEAAETTGGEFTLRPVEDNEDARAEFMGLKVYRVDSKDYCRGGR